MSTANAFLILFSILVALALVVLVFVFRWEPAALVFWRNVTFALAAALIIVPLLLPASVRWGNEASIFKAAMLVLLLAVSIKTLILVVRHWAVLTPAQKTAGYIAVAPLGLGVLGVLFFFGIVWLYSAGKG